MREGCPVLASDCLLAFNDDLGDLVSFAPRLAPPRANQVASTRLVVGQARELSQKWLRTLSPCHRDTGRR
jgi:hypothetical protein